MSRASLWFLLVAAALVALVGCKDDLPKATEITHMRVLGTKFEVVGDETRSTPKPGETVKATFATVFPSQTRTNEGVQAMLIGCTAPVRYTGGLPICQEFLDAATGNVGGDIGAALGMTTGTEKATCEDLPMPKIRKGRLSVQCLRGDPVAEFDVDAGFDAEHMLFLGVICEHGTAFIDPNDPLIFGCDANKGETTRVNGLIPVQYEKADENRNPSIDDLKLVLTTYTAPWVAPEGELPAVDNCNGDEQNDQDDALTLPHADPGKHEIRLEYDADARERVDGVPEDLELSIFTTAGEMERRFTLWSGDEDGDDKGKLRSTVEWKPPPFKDLTTHGKLARFFITLRDHRGGFDIATRVACVH